MLVRGKNLNAVKAPFVTSSARAAACLLLFSGAIEGCADANDRADAIVLADVTEAPPVGAPAGADALSSTDAGTSGGAPGGGVTLTPKYPSDWPAALPRIASLKLSGTGCPAGTIRIATSPDGASLLFRFTAFQVVIEAEQPVATKDCRLVIALQSNESRSFTVEQISTFGHADLAGDLRAGVSVDHRFRGTASAGEAAQGELPGPFVGVHEMEWSVDPENLIWSPCGAQSELDVHAALQLTNGASPERGYINLTATEDEKGWQGGYLEVKIGWRACQ